MNHEIATDRLVPSTPIRRTPATPGAWVPTLYLAMGVPFSMVIWVAGTMFKDLGYSDTSITVATATMGIAWSLKPFWAAFLDMSFTKRGWVLAMQMALAALFVALGLVLHVAHSFQWALLVLWMIAFMSATQDICGDGIYLTTLGKKEQAAWMGVQSMSWNVGRIFATAAVVWLAGRLEEAHDSRWAWTGALGFSAFAMALLASYHFTVLPATEAADPPQGFDEMAARFMDAVSAFFKKKSIWGMLLFVFLYRTGEGFLLVEAPLFMQADRAHGGLGVSIQQKALIDGTLSTIVMIVAGLLSGLFVSRFGLKRVLIVLAVCLNVPHLTFVILSQLVTPDRPVPLALVATMVCLEKFGYGFGFLGNMIYMMQEIAPGKYKMTHYAIATALMNLVLIPTQALSGPIADHLGYKAFFLFVLVASAPSVVAAWKAPFPSEDALDVSRKK